MTTVAPPSRLEFILLIALLTALVAMSIDTMLPALDVIAADFGVTEANQRQFVITSFFFGLTVGTLFYGPISDSTGRKPAIYVGLALYAVGCIMCFAATSFSMLLAGRLISGLGAAGPRVVGLAMVRDGLSGAAMARVMSFVMSVFMLVPIVAPSIGQVVLLYASWHVIFVGFLAMAAIAAAILFFRQEETLPPARRVALSLPNMVGSAHEFFRHPVAWSYTLASGFLFASFISYLGTSQQIFVDIYGQGKLFALWFALFAVAIALAMLVNARLVMKLGMRRLSKHALRACLILALLYAIVTFAMGGVPPLWVTGAYLFLFFFCSGLLFGNFTALAMEPVGRIAGMAAALNGTISSLMAVVFGGLAGLAFDGTLRSLALSFLCASLLALAASEYAEMRRTSTREKSSP